MLEHYYFQVNHVLVPAMGKAVVMWDLEFADAKKDIKAMIVQVQFMPTY